MVGRERFQRTKAKSWPWRSQTRVFFMSSNETEARRRSQPPTIPRLHSIFAHCVCFNGFVVSRTFDFFFRSFSFSQRRVDRHQIKTRNSFPCSTLLTKWKHYERNEKDSHHRWGRVQKVFVETFGQGESEDNWIASYPRHRTWRLILSSTLLTQLPSWKYSDMPTEMGNDAVDIATMAIDKFQSTNDYESASTLIKNSLDKKFGPSWQSVVGEGFGFDISCQQKYLLHLYYGKVGVLCYKS